MTDRDLRPDHQMEGRVSTWLTDTDLAPDEATRDLDRLLDEFPVTPQARRRFLGRWLDRDEGAGRRTREHDHPPPTETRRTRLMFSATGAIAALAILALAINVIDTRPAPPDTSAGATHVVATDGSGDFTTITEAVAAAVDGDTISLKPGTYTEAIVVDKDITLAGDGPREDIVITAPEGGPEWEVDFVSMTSSPYAIAVSGADAQLRDLTLLGVPSRLFFDEGSSVVEGVRLDAVGLTYRGGGSEDTCAVVVNEGTTASISESDFRAGGTLCVFGSATIERNELSEGAKIGGAFGPGSIVSGNHIHGEGYQGIDFLGDTQATVKGNTIADRENAIVPGNGISLSAEHAPVIEGNDIRGARTAIAIYGPHDAQVRDNSLDDNAVAIVLSGSDAVVEGNTISGEGAGITVSGGGAAPTISGNSIDVTGRVAIAMATRPTVQDNTVCGAGGSIVVDDDAEPDLGENQVC